MAEVNRRPNPKVPAFRGKTVCNVFFEDSTRTRLSFETAAKRLSADTMNFAVSHPASTRARAFATRSRRSPPWASIPSSSGTGRPAPHGRSAAGHGQGHQRRRRWQAHPTQALLDCYTIRSPQREPARSTGCDHDRRRHQAQPRPRSTATAFPMLGADVTLVAPPTLLPPAIDSSR